MCEQGGLQTWLTISVRMNGAKIPANYGDNLKVKGNAPRYY